MPNTRYLIHLELYTLYIDYWATFYQISSGRIFSDSMSAAHGSVVEESQLGDIVDLGQEVDLKDDF